MAGDFDGLAKALVIPQSVINNIDNIDKKINQIASDSEKMATHFTSAMTRMGGSTSDLLTKLERINSIVGTIGSANIGGLSNMSSNFSKTATEAEKAAENISKVANSVNKIKTQPVSQKDVASWVISNKEAEIKAEKELASIKEKYEKQEQARVEAIAKAEDSRRKAKKASYEEALKYAEQLDKKEEAAAKKRIAEAERQAKAQAKLDSKIRKANYGSYVTSVEGSLRTADKATTYTAREQAIKNLEAAMKKLNSTDKDYLQNLNKLSEAHRKLSQEQMKVKAYMGKMEQSQHSLMNTSEQLMRRLALVFSVSQITQYMKNIVRVTGEFELQNTALASILQNKEKADKLFAQVQQLAVKSPFTLKELVTYTKSLSAYQVEYEKLYDTTKMLADVSAGLGVDMQRLILAFGQVKAANFLRGTETRQFSEAGFNILGELAKYYSEIEGRVVSLGEVQDRQFKKMIAFKDVEEVFKRATAEGGLFYQMQERQAETIAGQISNLRDTVDIMLNDIGSGNRGAINFLIASVRGLIQYWEIFADILKGTGIAFAAYVISVVRASITNKAFAASSINATIEQKGLSGALAKTVRGFRDLKAAIVGNPITLLVGVLATLGYTLYDHYEKVEKARKEYDTLAKTVATSRKEFESSTRKIEEQNQNIQQLDDKVASLSKGTSDYYAAENEANKARENQKRLVEQLVQKYPELNSQIKKNKDGTVDLSKAQKAYNEQLEQTSYLLYLAKQGEGFFTDGIISNAADLTESLNAYRVVERDLKNVWNNIAISIDEVIKTNERVPESVKKSVLAIVNSTKPLEQKIDELRRVPNFASLFGDAYKIATNTLIDLRSAQRDVRSDQNDLAKNIDDIAYRYKKTYNVSTEEGKKAAAEAVSTFLDSLNIQDSAIRKFAQQRFEVVIGVKLDWSKAKVGPVLSGLEKKISDYIASNKLTLLPKIQAGSGGEKYFENLKSQLKDITEEMGKLNRATVQREENQTNKQRIASLKEEEKQIRKILAAFGEDYDAKKETKSFRDAQKAALELLKERIQLLKDAGEEYEKLLKYYKAEDAKANVKKAFQDSFSMAGLSMDMEFDVSGVIDAIRNITNTLGKEGQKVINKALYELESKRDIEVRAKGLDEIKAQVEDIFSNYEFNLDLTSKGVDKNVFKDFLKSVGASDLDIQGLGLDIDTFEKAQAKVREIIAELTAKGGQNNLDAAKAFQEKLTQLEVTEAKKRFEELATLREKYQDKEEKIRKVESDVSGWEKELQQYESVRVKVEKLSSMLSRGALTGEEAENAKAEIEELSKSVNKSQEELLQYRIENGKDTILQLKSEALQLTSFWRTLFGDLEDLSVNSLRELTKNVDEIVGSAKEVKGSKGQTVGYTASYTDRNGIKKEVTLTLEQYQRLLKQNNQVAKEIQEKNPFIALWDAIVKGKNEGETQLDYITRLEGMLTSVTDAAFGVANNLADIFGANDEAKELLSNIQGIASGAVNLGTGIARIASGDIIGGAMSAVSGIAGVVTAIGKIHDNKREKEIKRQLELVEKLEKSYEKLEQAIDDAYSVDTLNAAKEQSIEELKAQNEAYEKAIAAEKAKKAKNVDKERIKEWEQAQEDNLERIKELQEQITADLGGFGSEANVKSAAQEFADAWLEAFLETGDGLEALEDKWDEYIQNVIAKQLMMKGTEKYLKPVMDMLDGMLEDSTFTPEEQKELQNKLDEVLPQLNEFWKSVVGSFDLSGLKETEGMSGLEQAITGVSEETAQALEALLNSVRFFTSDSNAVLHNIYNWLVNPPTESPLLQELRVQSSYLNSINSLLGSVIKPSQGKGKVLRIEMV